MNKEQAINILTALLLIGILILCFFTLQVSNKYNKLVIERNKINQQLDDCINYRSYNINDDGDDQYGFNFG